MAITNINGERNIIRIDISTTCCIRAISFVRRVINEEVLK